MAVNRRRRVLMLEQYAEFWETAMDGHTAGGSVTHGSDP